MEWQGSSEKSYTPVGGKESETTKAARRQVVELERARCFILVATEAQ
jgi:hypothetical protein